jgi:tetratricopeptide (TPR) repeat protein
LKRDIHGDRNLEVAINLHNLAALCSARRRYEQAEPLYQESISIREELLGENHVELVPVLQNYALLLRKTHREDEAAEIEERITRIES